MTKGIKKLMEDDRAKSTLLRLANYLSGSRAERVHRVLSASFGDDFQFCRQVLLPDDQNDYQSTLLQYESEEFDSEPIMAHKNLVAGLLSYHYSLVEPVMSLMFFKGGVQETNIDTLKEMFMHQDEINGSLQSSLNQVEIASYLNNLTAFSLAGMEFVEEGTMQLRALPRSEDLIYLSSDKREFDIQGYREEIGVFHLASRYDLHKILGGLEDSEVPFYASNDKLEGKNIELIRVNLPYGVLKRLLQLDNGRMDFFTNGELDEDAQALVDVIETYGKFKDDDILDLHLTKDLILDIKKVDTHRVLINTFSPYTGSGKIGKSILLQVKGHITALNNLAEKNLLTLDNYSDTKHFFNEGSFPGTHDIFAGGYVPVKAIGDFEVKHDFIPKDILALERVLEMKKLPIKTGFYNNVFELIQKNRMPTNETNIRRQDELKRLSPYIGQETKRFLLPLTRYHFEMAKKSQVINIDHKMLPIFVSPLAQSQRSESALELLTLMKSVKEVISTDPDKARALLENIDMNRVMKDMVIRNGGLKFLQGSQEKAQMQQERQGDEALDRSGKRAEYLSKIIAAKNQRQGGGPPQPGGDLPQPPPQL